MNIKVTCALFVYLSCSYSLFGQIPKGRIIFSSRAKDSGDTELYAINSDGTGEHMITHPNNKGKDLPGVFHNRIVYRQVEDKKSQRASILITGIDGGQPKPIIENKGVCNPKWSHDGKLIAYENYHGNNNNTNEIWVIDSNGKNNRELISDARHPCWSYDNRTMLFTRDYQVWAMDLNKGTEQKLTNFAGKDTVALFPAISPDGKLFAWIGQFGNNSGIFIAGLKTGKIQKFIPRCADVFFWTDDPRYIVYSCIPERGKTYQIVIVNVVTGAKIPVTYNDRNNGTPCWVYAAK